VIEQGGGEEDLRVTCRVESGIEECVDFGQGLGFLVEFGFWIQEGLE